MTEAMNWAYCRQSYPNYWYELLAWDGNPTVGNEARQVDKYTAAGQTWTVERYIASVVFGMWLLRPNCVREFRGHREPAAANSMSFERLSKAVDTIYALGDYWKTGTLLTSGSPHPYRDALPNGVSLNRWYALSTDREPLQPWKLTTALPVWILGIQLEGRPTLLYGFAPLGLEKNVEVEVPGVGRCRLPEVPVEGQYWYAETFKV